MCDSFTKTCYKSELSDHGSCVSGVCHLCAFIMLRLHTVWKTCVFMLQRKMFQVCVCRRWSHVLPSARFQLEHFVRLSDLRLTGPEVHWTVCVCMPPSLWLYGHACVRLCVLIWVNARMCDCVCMFVWHASSVCVCVCVCACVCVRVCVFENLPV